MQMLPQGLHWVTLVAQPFLRRELVSLIKHHASNPSQCLSIVVDML